ncbi:MAG: hypothetical protein F6K16_05455 [Symploca sp. SIO2B6]|nr:hypothetical protein [Symploca sp. SIO2B6]
MTRIQVVVPERIKRRSSTGVSQILHLVSTVKMSYRRWLNLRLTVSLL